MLDMAGQLRNSPAASQYVGKHLLMMSWGGEFNRIPKYKYDLCKRFLNWRMKLTLQI